MATGSYFTEIDQNLPEEELAQQITDAANSLYWLDEDVDLSDDAYALLTQWAHDARAKVRRSAIKALCQFAPIGWDDLEIWALDPDKDVRNAVIDVPFTSESVEELIAANTPRYIHLLLKVAERYADFTAIDRLRDLSGDDTLLEQIWPEMVRLLDKNEIDLNTVLYTTYFEDVIPERNWGPDDPHLASWISAHGSVRQIILLYIAGWMGLNEGRLKEIMQALTKSKDAYVAGAACNILKGKLRYSDGAGDLVWVNGSTEKGRSA